MASRVVGDGSPKVLLLHGLGGSNRYWAGDFDRLGSAGSLVVPDLPGFGRSQSVANDFALDAHANAVACLLDELGTEEPLLVGAHSFGTLVALRLSTLRPDLVRSIVAFGPPWYADEQTARRSLARMGPMARLFALDKRWSHALCRWVCAHRRGAAVMARLTRLDLPCPVATDAVQHTWPSYWGTLEALLHADAASMLTATTVPIVVVVGDADEIPDRRLLSTQHACGRITELSVWPGDHDLPLVSRTQAVRLLERAATASAESR